MAEQTLTAMYDTRGAAEYARDQLVGIGVAREAITMHGSEVGTAATSAAASEDKGFWSSLANFFMPDEDRYTYSEGLNRGGCLLTARVPDELREQSADILEASEPVDLDERSASWRQEGWAGHAATAPAGHGAPTASPPPRPDASGDGSALAAAAGIDTPTKDDVIQAAEENLRVLRHGAGRGSARVRSYVTERPVEEQVELRPVARKPTGTGTVVEGSVVDPELAGTPR